MPESVAPHSPSQPAIVVRDAAEADMVEVQAIYAHHVLHGVGTFEEVAPAIDEMIARRVAVLRFGLPYLVAQMDDAVVGYAYASPYHARSAYRFTIEDSIYVAESLRGRGIGAALLGALIARCERGPWRQMVALIGDSGNAGSIALHRKFGFELVGTLQAVGFKFGGWVDVVLMQRGIGAGSGESGLFH